VEDVAPGHTHLPQLADRALILRLLIVGAVIAAMLLWLGPFAVPTWAVVAFLVILFSLAVVLSVERMRVECRLARAFWQALTRK
jgi:hypothetical protein